MTKRRIFAAALMVAMTVVAAERSAAQVATGTIVGTVSDANGVVPARSFGRIRRRSVLFIEERSIKELPLNGRNFATLVYLTPGITPGQAGEISLRRQHLQSAGAPNFNALGHEANANAWLIDSIDNNDRDPSTTLRVVPSNVEGRIVQSELSIQGFGFVISD